MGILDLFKKKTEKIAEKIEKNLSEPIKEKETEPVVKKTAETSAEKTAESTKENVYTIDEIKVEECLDDITFIRAIRHITGEIWHQFDVLLAARIYGWENMIVWADYMAEAELNHVSQVTVCALVGAPEVNITDLYKQNGEKCSQIPELRNERGVLSVAGISRTLKAPMKIVFMNQTNELRFFTTLSDEKVMAEYIESTIRRNFGTADAMKLGKPLPEK